MTFFRSNIVFVFAFLLLLTGCDAATNSLKPDREANLEMQDYKDALAPRNVDVSSMKGVNNASSIPALKPYVASTSQTLKSMPLVSISVNQSVPLRDILFELAQQADYDLELDPRIQGSIIFTARNRPLDEVVQRISDIAGLRYSFDDNVMRVEVDAPYNKTYKIDYLSYVRSNTSTIRNDIGVVSGDGADTGSSFSSSAESEANFWGELEANLTQILQANSGNLATSTTPMITAADQDPNVQAVGPTGVGPNGERVTIQAPQAILNVTSLPDGSASGEEGSAYAAPDSTFAMNKQAGLISVYAPAKAHEEIQEYLTVLRRAATAQVLIEAKILEVVLNDEYATGIDWRAVNFPGSEFTMNYLGNGGAGLLNSLTGNSAGTPASFTGNATSGAVVGYAGNDVQAVIQAVSEFGNVRALASPRLTVLNNQSAVLNVATNRVYFEIDVEVTQNENTSNTTVDSQIRNVPEGVVINVQPSINLDRDTIAMAVRPTITSISSSVSDPAVAFAAGDANITSNIPEVNVQEIDSVIQVNSGQPVVMGGLLQDRVVTNQNGIPVLSEVPMMGALFRQNGSEIRKTELIIFLQATILKSPNDSVHDTDKDIYRTFASDRRPLKF